MDIWVPCANKEVMGLAGAIETGLTITGNVLATQWKPQGFLNPKDTLNHALYVLMLWADSLELHIARTTPTLPSQKKKKLGYHTRQGTLTNEILNRRKGAMEGLIMEKENSK